MSCFQFPLKQVFSGLTAKWLTKSVCRASLIIVLLQLLHRKLGDFI